jgi:hypothetical protein
LSQKARLVENLGNFENRSNSSEGTALLYRYGHEINSSINLNSTMPPLGAIPSSGDFLKENSLTLSHSGKLE